MRSCRHLFRWVAFVYLIIYLHIQTISSSQSEEPSLQLRRCPSNITIHSKRYFYTYLRIFDNGTTSGLFPLLVMANLSSACCDGQRISFTFLNETTGISVQKLLFMEKEKRRKSKFYDNSSLEFYFPTYTTKADESLVYKTFYFIEVMKSPGPAFIMLADDLKDPPDPSLVLIECWPIFVLLLVMAMVVGVIGWFLDHSKNREQFPENFYHGSWVGFWWAVVTMTTVGYGDKAPKSFPARLVTILWMITGTIVASLFTANVTTVLTTKNVAALQDVLGQTVGVLNSKHFFQREINEGASFREYRDQDSLKQGLYKREISRILVPNYLDHLYFTTKKHIEHDYLVAKVVKHPFSVGLGLANDIKLDDEMKEFLRCWERTIVNNYEESGIDYSIIDPSLYHAAENAKSLLNQKSILRLTFGLLVLLFVFLILGSLWEFWKRRRQQKDKMDAMRPAEIEMMKVSQTINF